MAATKFPSWSNCATLPVSSFDVTSATSSWSATTFEAITPGTLCTSATISASLTGWPKSRLANENDWTSNA